MRHINGFAIRRDGKLIDTKGVVSDPGHYVMHEVIGYQAAVFARADVHTALRDVEHSLIGGHRYSTLARFGNGELLHQGMVVVYVICIDLAVDHYIQPVRCRAATRIGSDTDRESGSASLEALCLERVAGAGILIAPLDTHHARYLLGPVAVSSREGPGGRLGRSIQPGTGAYSGRIDALELYVQPDNSAIGGRQAGINVTAQTGAVVPLRAQEHIGPARSLHHTDTIVGGIIGRGIAAQHEGITIRPAASTAR